MLMLVHLKGLSRRSTIFFKFGYISRAVTFNLEILFCRKSKTLTSLRPIIITGIRFKLWFTQSRIPKNGTRSQVCSSLVARTIKGPVK